MASKMWVYVTNRHYEGIAFREIKGKLFPSVGMKKPGEHIRVHFGQSPFVFDIDGMMTASIFQFCNSLLYCVSIMPPERPRTRGGPENAQVIDVNQRVMAEHAQHLEASIEILDIAAGDGQLAFEVFGIRKRVTYADYFT